MSLYAKVAVLLILLSGLFYGGYRVHQSIWQAGYSAAQSEFKAASEAAVRENEQIAREEAREIPKVVAELEEKRKFYQSLLVKAGKLNKQPIVIEEDPVNNVKIIRVFGLSDDALRLFNDATRGSESPPEVRPDPYNSLSR